MLRKTDLKSLMYSLMIFIALFFIADRAIGYTLKYLYTKQKRGAYFETTYALKHVKEELLIFGSSRAVRHYDPVIIADSLKLSAFNVGKLANTLLYSDAAFSQILTFHKPKVVILDISPIEFAASERERGQKSMVDILLKYHDLPVIDNRVKHLNKKEWLLSKIFSTYRFNSSMYTILINNHGSSNIDRTKGFEARHGSKVSTHHVNEDNFGYREDPIMIKTFHNFLEKARKNNIMVHVVISPTTLYHKYNSVPKIKAITKAFGYSFVDYSRQPEFKKATLFYDKTHLNRVGAKKFTELLADSLNQVDLKNWQKLLNVKNPA